ncbi:hypothetical protein GURASL_08270 [Geotalea uraniireducens]|uniref:histidine kinase n=1 Tax=Geotalea uraniireducens TaxID=351604 RepID=A0ABM8EHK7_9BACT|nr:PAS domain S-box protein [Geotalea uraniireducens]BDV41904.1 hypothetical protein GURASL_08270 [Geotalea uraniireducens]
MNGKRLHPGLLGTFLLVVSTLFGVHSVLDYSRAMGEARHQSKEILTQSSYTVHAEISRLMDTVRIFFALTERGIRSGRLDFARPATANDFFVPFLAVTPSITSVNYGDSNGNGYLILNTGNGWKNRIRNIATPGEVTWISFAKDGRQTERSIARDTYDPRIRPWYRDASGRREIQWGVPYIFRTTGDLGITASMAIQPTPPGTTERIIGADIMLKDLSRFLAGINLRRDAAIRIIDEQGYLLASSAATAFARQLGPAAAPPQISSPTFALYRDIVGKYHSCHADFFTIRSQGEAYFVKVAPYRLDNGKILLTVLTIPEQSFLNEFMAKFYRNLLLFILFLLLMTVYFLVRYIIPVKRLTRYAGAFRIDRPSLPLPVNRHDEIGILSATINGMIATIRDNAAALRRSEDHYRTLVENVGSIILRWECSGTITFINEYGARFFGYRQDELVGRSIFDTIVPSNDSHGKDLHGMIADICAYPDRYRSNQNENMARDGRRVWINWANVAVCDEFGTPTEILSVGNDVTERVSAERQIRLLNDQLEERIRQRTMAYEASNRELEAFSYSVSHDLRAPLRHIDGFSRILLEDFASEIPPEGRGYLERISKGVRRMGMLIDDLLELSRVTREELRPATVDLSAMAREIIDELRAAAPDRRVDVTIADGLTVEGDPTLLRIALFNLLENAWKYTSHNDSATMSFAIETLDGIPAYCIRDNGVGFDIRYANKLFLPFQRLHSSDEFEGTGIGLATVQRIIARHGGTIRATGEVGGGAAFCFTLSSPGR